MSRLARNIRKFNVKAAEVRQALQAAPQKIAELRQSVALTADQLQQLRNEVQNGLRGLMITPDQLAQAAAEINASQPLLEQAGYELTGVEVEYGHAQKIVVRLEEFEDVPQADLRRLLLANEGRRTAAALLSAIIKGKDVAGKIEFTNLPFRGLVVHLGASAAVRVCWAAEETPQSMVEVPELATPPVVAPPKPEKIDTPLPNFGSGGFFETRASSMTIPPPSGPAPAPEPEQLGPSRPAAASPLPAGPSAPLGAQTPAASPSSQTTDWRHDALDRFKKMPSVSKYHR